MKFCVSDELVLSFSDFNSTVVMMTVTMIIVATINLVKMMRHELRSNNADIVCKNSIIALFLLQKAIKIFYVKQLDFTIVQKQSADK